MSTPAPEIIRKGFISHVFSKKRVGDILRFEHGAGAECFGVGNYTAKLVFNELEKLVS